MKPGFVTAYGGPRDGEDVPTNEVDWRELAGTRAWRGYVFAQSVAGILTHVKYHARLDK
jgi:hypothetical protein